MRNYQVRRAFIDKERVAAPLTNRLISGGYQQKNGGYIDFAKECGVNNPSQYWHLIHSWSDLSKPDARFTKRIQCGELIFWMSEVSGAVPKNELTDLVDEIVQSPKDRCKWNKVIRNKCFDRIAELVEAHEA
ncbi:hypothetical protein [Actinomyces urinae]|uniref:hypothetical protein n=1 Tax=Actinomyces urinae TaxID=1689268 RepID=UPI000930EE0F|nr:hypothetical protein [Actinomyces urinae]